MTTTVKIKGMSCNHCVMAVSKALEQIEGLNDVQVDLSNGRATLYHDGPIDVGRVKDQIENAGYEVD